MRGTIPPLPQYVMSWCSVKAQGQIYLFFLPIWIYFCIGRGNLIILFISGDISRKTLNLMSSSLIRERDFWTLGTIIGYQNITSTEECRTLSLLAQNVPTHCSVPIKLFYFLIFTFSQIYMNTYTKIFRN